MQIDLQKPLVTTNAVGNLGVPCSRAWQGEVVRNGEEDEKHLEVGNGLFWKTSNKRTTVATTKERHFVSGSMKYPILKEGASVKSNLDTTVTTQRKRLSMSAIATCIIFTVCRNILQAQVRLLHSYL